MTFISILLLLLSTLLLRTVQLGVGMKGEKENNGEKSQAIVLHPHRAQKSVLWSGISSSIT
jgi:hypothetical protein